MMLSGLGFSGDGKDAAKASAKETKAVKQALRKFFNTESQFYSKGVLALPPGYQISKLNMDNPSGLIQALNMISCANVANIFQVPAELIYVSAGATERTQKESRRLFLSGGFASFCKIIEDELDRLSGYETKFQFNIDKLRIKGADLREEASLAQLLGIYTKEELKSKIEAH